MGTSHYQTAFVKSKLRAENSAVRSSKFDEDKIAGKQKEKETAGKEIQNNSNLYARPFLVKCFKCNQPGHRSSDCPLRKGIHMVERDEEEGEDATYCEADGGDDEYDDDDEGQTYVIQRLMLAPKQEDESQRNQLFRTRCTVNNCILNVIIDGGSCKNIVSKKTAEDMKLPVEKHPQPYTIGWIKSGEQIVVNKRCRIPFSIGKYKDEVYCDVVDMDACQLLFERPWQYDVDAQHSGRDSTYQVTK